MATEAFLVWLKQNYSDVDPTWFIKEFEGGYHAGSVFVQIYNSVKTIDKKSWILKSGNSLTNEQKYQYMCDFVYAKQKLEKFEKYLMNDCGLTNNKLKKMFKELERPVRNDILEMVTEQQKKAKKEYKEFQEREKENKKPKKEKETKKENPIVFKKIKTPTLSSEDSKEDSSSTNLDDLIEEICNPKQN